MWLGCLSILVWLNHGVRQLSALYPIEVRLLWSMCLGYAIRCEKCSQATEQRSGVESTEHRFNERYAIGNWCHMLLTC